MIFGRQSLFPPAMPVLEAVVHREDKKKEVLPLGP
jgi:hypothetical protein